MQSIRRTLRDATRDCHAEVDQLFGNFDLHSRTGYTAFLRAHAAAALPAEQRVLKARLPHAWIPRCTALTADLVELAAPPVRAVQFPGAFNIAEAWGALYVLEGSKLGGAVLNSRVGVDLPRRYLAAGHTPGQWRAFEYALEAAQRPDDPDWIPDSVRGAQLVFAAFAKAARAASPAPIFAPLPILQS